MIRTPPSNNGLFRQLARTDNPANWGGANTFWNRVPGQNPLLFDPNCKCFDPTTQLVLNPNVWTDAPVGQFGSSAPFYNDYRWQRQRAESLSLGRTFKLAREGKINFDVRAELFNVLNRLSLANPLPVSVSGFPPPENNPAAQTVRNQFGALTAGYGFHQHVQPRGRRRQQRSGQIVGRLSF